MRCRGGLRRGPLGDRIGGPAYLSAKTWAGKEPKAIDQVLTEIAVITANGGRWNIGEFPTGLAHPIDDFQENSSFTPAQADRRGRT